jgi:hypothetical protein
MPKSYIHLNVQERALIETQLREDFKPVQPGEHDVEKNEIKPPIECRHQAGCTIMDGLDRVVRLGEDFANQLAQAHVIINRLGCCTHCYSHSPCCILFYHTSASADRPSPGPY